MKKRFNALAVAGETVSDEVCVVYLLANLPDSYNVLVTTLEANAEVPKLEIVSNISFKRDERGSSTNENAMPSHTMPCRPKPKYINGKKGHIQWHCKVRSIFRVRRGEKPLKK